MYLCDMHTHTLASGHGTKCTITDMVREAAARGLRLLGITDHGPATTLAGTPSYFRSLTSAPRQRFGIEVLYGAECNILDCDGRLDLDDDLLRQLDYVIVSMHLPTFTPSGRKENTRAFLSAMQHPGVRILGHCDDPRYPLDYPLLIQEASRMGVIPEINEMSLQPGGYRGDTRPCCRRLLECCWQTGVPLLLSSDSHGPDHIGEFPYAAAFIHEEVFPESLILNNQPDRVKSLLLR